MPTLYFDTNVLLNLYSYPFEIVDELINLIEDKYDVIIPAQVIIEFGRHHKTEVKKEKSNNVFVRSKNNLMKRFNDLKRDASELSKDYVFKHSSAKLKDIINNINTSIDNNGKILIDEADELTKSFHYRYDYDDIVEKFVSRNSSSFILNEEKKNELSSLYISRVTLGIKPGLTDFAKIKEKIVGSNNNDKYRPCGDYFIWFEILQNQGSPTDVIFVTDERKCDWWEDGQPGIIDSYLKNEFADKNRNTNIDIMLFPCFLTTYFSSLENVSPQLYAFIADEQKAYKSIFVDSEFLDIPFEELIQKFNLEYVFGDLTTFVSGDVVETDDINIDDGEIIRDDNVPQISFDHDSCSIEAEFISMISGTMDIRVEIGGHKDGIEEFYSNIPYTAKVKIRSRYIIDWPTVSFDSLESYEILEITVDEEEGYKQMDGDLYEDEPGIYGNCPDCGAPINEDNYSGDTYCKECAKRH